MERKISLSSGNEDKPKKGYDYVVISRNVFENLDGLCDEQFADVFRNIYNEFFGGTVFWGADCRTSAHNALWKFVKDAIKRDTVERSTQSIIHPGKSGFIK